MNKSNQMGRSESERETLRMPVSHDRCHFAGNICFKPSGELTENQERSAL